VHYRQIVFDGFDLRWANTLRKEALLGFRRRRAISSGDSISA
jgi:hypothetical protein